MGRMTFDTEKATFNLAKLKKGGMHFELVIDPDLAMDFKEGKPVEVREVLRAEQVFADAKKGNIAPEDIIERVFDTTDFFKVATIILNEGEIQLTSEYRDKKREEKKKRIMEIIHINAIDSKTGLPHPMTRLENAFEQAKVHIDERRRAEDQVQDILDKLRPIIPIKFDVKIIEVHVPANYAAKLYSTVKGYGKIKKEDWLNDGSWKAQVEIPAGLQTEFFDDLNSKTHGSVETKIL